jgi:exodeoxyribonuclease VII small subunit
MWRTRVFKLATRGTLDQSLPVTTGKTDPSREPGFDELLDRLQKVVTKLEAGNLGLEDSLAAYEEGVGLARSAHSVLDGAEKRVELLVRAGSGGSGRQPLDGLPPDDEADPG